MGATTNLGAPVAGLLTSVGGTLAGAGGQLPGGLPVGGLDGVLGGLGGAVASAGGLLHATPGNTNPLGNTLAHATSAVSSLTGGLGLGGITAAPPPTAVCWVVCWAA
ncbi:lipoprotein [Bordetella pertussis]|nr:lipoprotein [Bordetella pertussis]